jgi:hypothetical protein
MQTEIVRDLLPIVTRLQCRKIGTVEGSDIFAVPRGWAAELLRSEADVVTAETPSTFDTALQEPDTRAIFVPRNTFGWNLMERILGRNSLVKTIFWEE